MIKKNSYVVKIQGEENLRQLYSIITEIINVNKSVEYVSVYKKLLAMCYYSFDSNHLNHTN